jgi:hypothetical protein
MTYKGVITQTTPNNTTERNWQTWQITIHPMITPGRHTYQLLSHYFVWQEADKYWAEFNAKTDIKSFTITLSTTTQQNAQSDSEQNSPPPESNIWLIYSAIAAITIASILETLILLPRQILKHL